MNTNQHPQLTRRIAGHDLTLTSGCWYIASRPMANRARAAYPITIQDADGHVTAELAPMSYDDANAFLAAFNDGPLSFDGRTW